MNHPTITQMNYLGVIASGTREDVFSMIEIEKGRLTFNIPQPSRYRALLLPMAVNNRMVWTDRGIQWVAETVSELAAIGTTTASSLLNTFQHVRSLKPNLLER
jgi:aminopeptidase N